MPRLLRTAREITAVARLASAWKSAVWRRRLQQDWTVVSRRLVTSATFGLLLLPAVLHAEPAADTSRGDRMISAYFRRETAKLRDDCLGEIKTLDDWQARRGECRRQLMEMLGLDPPPERTPLDAAVTARTEHDEFTVERLHFQSRPGLYVTGDLYLPKQIERPLPAVLYVCGHGRVKINGVSYGNKTHYQHHGGWFARNGYVCLTIDSLQLGEIEGIHHGTYRHGMWWWLNRGYTPAGVEAWNCVRALDYLQSRKEVDSERIGVTGRSGGGAYSWWIAAIDDRIKCAVPVAGITDLQNHVVDGCVEGHCDCMYMVNTYRWDYPQVAALVAPRPLLISNTDSDRIFPLDGVYRTFERVRKIYALHDAADKVALHITAGGHKDTQELRVHAFRWLNHHLKGDDELIEKTAVKLLEPAELKVFDDLPRDQRNTEIQETFVAAAAPPAAESKPRLLTQQARWLAALREKSFAAWPQDDAPPTVEAAFVCERDGVSLKAFDFTSQEEIPLRLYIAQRAGLKQPDLVVLNVLDQRGWRELLAALRPAFADQFAGETLPQADPKAFSELQGMFKSFKWAMAYVCPRGVGPTAWNQSERKQTQIRRRFYLLGQTLDGMRVYDVRRAVQAVREIDGLHETPLWLQSERAMAGVALYASLFEPQIARLDLYELPVSHREGPYLLNVRRYFDLPQAVGMAVARSKVVIYAEDGQDWKAVRRTAELLGREKEFQIRKRAAALIDD